MGRKRYMRAQTVCKAEIRSTRVLLKVYVRLPGWLASAFLGLAGSCIVTHVLGQR